MKLYQKIAQLLAALRNCQQADTLNPEWEKRHEQSIIDLVRQYMPSGSGVDTGTTLDFEKSRPDRLVFNFSFHHLTEFGFYDGWTDHTCVVTPSLAHGYEVRITGRNRNDIKEYLQQLYHEAMYADI